MKLRKDTLQLKVLTTQPRTELSAVGTDSKLTADESTLTLALAREGSEGAEEGVVLKVRLGRGLGLFDREGCEA